MYTYLHRLLDYFPNVDVSYAFPRNEDELDEYVYEEFWSDITADEREEVCAIVAELFEDHSNNLPGMMNKEYILHDKSVFVEIEGDKLLVSTFRHRA